MPNADLAAAASGNSARLVQAKELLGRHYSRSIVRAGESVENVERFVYVSVRDYLKGRWKKQSRKIARAIIKESKKHLLDPLFLMAVIQSESSFNPETKGSFGEIGLMQILPGTATWISKLYKVRYRGNLQDPVTNIRIGAAYFAHLRERHDFHGRLYLAAYNMGSGNVAKALERDIWPKDYAERVMQNYIKLYHELKKHSEVLALVLTSDKKI